MKSNELRIGNWVEFRGKPDQLLEFDYRLQLLTFGTPESNWGPGIPHEEIKPIQLTEEWLRRFGFVLMYREDDWFAEKENPWFIITKIDGSYRLAFYKTATINYVHQLQNLYFALTGKELKTL